MPPNTMTLKDLENFLSVHLPSVSFAEGGPVGTQYPRIGGGLSKAAGALRRAEEERQFKKSVFAQPREERWVPEYEKEPALEAPMISPDDLLGTGIPTKIAMALKGAAPLIGGLGVIKNKGGNWLNGSVEGALKGLKKPSIDDYLARYPNQPASEAMVQEFLPNSALNNWIDKQLTRYVKNQMATPEDPVRALAEQGILHFTPQNNFTHPAENMRRSAREAGSAVPGIAGRSLLARSWEDVADNSIGTQPISKRVRFESQLEGSPWMADLPPETLVHHANRNPEGLGFNHLTDELSNALRAHGEQRQLNEWLAKANTPEEIAITRRGNAVSLPEALHLKPQDLDKMGMDQAVRHVAKINDWRAATMAEANAQKANNAATVLHKEYPDKGFRWVELRKGELPEGWTAQERERGYSTFVDPEGKVHSGDRADPRYSALADALKYEGDTMGHCVGGYCDDVASGRTKIYSLRDAKGQPHVTVEVQPYGSHNEDIMFAELTDKLGRQPNQSELAEAMSVAPMRIKQIKGKANAKPNDEYLPFVQDFVKSGKWSDVGDLQNAGLQRAGWAPDVLERMKAHGIEAPEYGTADEINAALNALNKAKGFAHGGPVNKNNLSVQQLRAIIAQINQEHINAA